jgi:hypothetical protein
MLCPDTVRVNGVLDPSQREMIVATLPGDSRDRDRSEVVIDRP